MELLNKRKLSTRKRVVMCYPVAGINFIKDRLDVVHWSRDFINLLYMKEEIVLGIWMEYLKGQKYNKRNIRNF